MEEGDCAGDESPEWETEGCYVCHFLKCGGGGGWCVGRKVAAGSVGGDVARAVEGRLAMCSGRVVITFDMSDHRAL